MSKFNVPEMSCGHCTAAIEKAVIQADAQANISFDLEERIVSITSALDNGALMNVLKEEGYESSLI